MNMIELSIETYRKFSLYYTERESALLFQRPERPARSIYIIIAVSRPKMIHSSGCRAVDGRFASIWSVFFWQNVRRLCATLEPRESSANGACSKYPRFVLSRDFVVDSVWTLELFLRVEISEWKTSVPWMYYISESERLFLIFSEIGREYCGALALSAVCALLYLHIYKHRARQTYPEFLSRRDVAAKMKW